MEESHMPTTGQKMLAEFVGTFTLIFIGAGAIMAFAASGVVDGAAFLGIAIAHGLAIGVMATATGHISGGHFNPAVTCAMLVAKKIDNANALAYIASQLAGACAGA